MSRNFYHATGYMLGFFLLTLVAFTACEVKMSQEAVSALEAELLGREPAVDKYEIATVRTAAAKKIPSSIDKRWCVEVAFNSNGQSTNEYFLIDQKGESFECKQVTEDQLTFKETGCYW